ncbi:MAG TPA: S8 family serine peptidase, partial [Pyrinomonadaceae bacterium]|nr:S8 family serine peptidase [Pyrinomonadaceae bacterium]
IKSRNTRGAEPIDKLAPELRILFDQYARGTRGGDRPPMAFGRAQLNDLFGIRTENRNPQVGVVITLAGGETATLKGEGAKIYYRSGDTVYADVPVRVLERIARQRSVSSISAAKAVSIPTPPEPPAPPVQQPLPGARGDGNGGAMPAAVAADNEFDRQGLTGKGVIVGVIDTGIDWRHKDFIRPDGTSRILYLWDQMDNSFADSNGRIGTAPPKLAEGEDPGPGTLYTGEQIDAALNGGGTVNSMDNFGHGTAAAGTAAGNGRATANGVAPGTHAGVAPEADLIIVKAADCGGFGWTYLLGTIWIAQKAKELGRPAVINHSLGGHYTAHDGQAREELVMNRLVGAGNPGLAITVSAGNEGQYSMHATGRFGPRLPGQKDFEGAPIEIFVSPYRTDQVAWVSAYFDHADDWGIVLVGSGDFLVDEQGQPLRAYIYKYNNAVTVQLQKGAKKPDYFDDFVEAIEWRNTQLALTGDRVDQLFLPFPPGAYWVKGFGSSEKVKTGRFDLYAPDTRRASALFTFGADKRRMVGSPGNASNVITVGAYDFRERWPNRGGQQTLYNLGLSDISDYSSPGGLRDDGLFKPEIAAPATYTISSLSSTAAPDGKSCDGNSMGSMLGATAVTRDGFHIAWSGTSASAPFTAGVIALMLQKNQTLDNQQIKQILIRTALKDDKYVGAAPNPEWGYGKINPAAAIAAVPPARRDRRRARRTVR